MPLAMNTAKIIKQFTFIFHKSIYMKHFFLSLPQSTTAITQAQKMADPKPFAATITEADLKKHLYIVASKDFEGRETATEGQRKAAAYIENHFKNIGLAPGNGSNYQLYYPVYQ